MGMKTIFFLGLIVGYAVGFGWDSSLDAESMAAQSEVIADKGIDCQETSPEFSVTAHGAETDKAKDKDSEKPGSKSDNIAGLADMLSRNDNSYADIYGVQDALVTEDTTIVEVAELEMLSTIAEEHEIQIEIEDAALSTLGSTDQYDPETGREYDEIEQEEQFRASQFMDDGKLTVEEEIVEYNLSKTEEEARIDREGTLESVDPVE